MAHVYNSPISTMTAMPTTTKAAPIRGSISEKSGTFANPAPIFKLMATLRSAHGVPVGFRADWQSWRPWPPMGTVPLYWTLRH